MGGKGPRSLARDTAPATPRRSVRRSARQAKERPRHALMGPFSRCISILIYHRVVSEPDALLPDLPSADEFDRQMAAVERWFTVLPLREAAARLREGTLPVRSACVT